MQHSNIRRQGFTLIELLVVIAIIVITTSSSMRVNPSGPRDPRLLEWIDFISVPLMVKLIDVIMTPAKRTCSVPFSSQKISRLGSPV